MLKGKVGKNLDVFLAYAHVTGGNKEVPYSDGWTDSAGNHYDKDYRNGNWTGSNAFVISASTNIARNLRFTADYVHTNANDDAAMAYRTAVGQPWDTMDKGSNNSYLARLDYKWTNPSVVGSFAAFLGYHYVGRNGYLFSDENDGAIAHNSRGWQVGFRYVPWKNVVWETKYVTSTQNMQKWHAWDNTYRRNLIRTQLDFYF